MSLDEERKYERIFDQVRERLIYGRWFARAFDLERMDIDRASTSFLR